MSFVINLVYSFCQAARDMQKDYVEAWLKGDVKDYDMDMTLIDERKARSHTLKKLQKEMEKLN